MKTLRVCLSSELPPLLERDKDFIYFVYDKLEVFFGQNYFQDQYAIVETFPEQDPIRNMLYFCLDDGKAKTIIDIMPEDIAEIESEEQLEILKRTGTSFFVNADKRYLDVKTKLITLPFKNGTYELTVSLASDLEINENTVIGFNPEKQEFEIIGDIQDFDLVFSRRYRGKETPTIKMNVDDHIISADVKVSPEGSNIIQVQDDGLYASVKDRVSTNVFEAWAIKFREYYEHMQEYIAELAELVEKAEEIISGSTIADMILQTLESVYPEIDTALENYDYYAEKIDAFPEEIYDYADQQIQLAKDEINESLDIYMRNPWGNIDDNNED